MTPLIQLTGVEKAYTRLARVAIGELSLSEGERIVVCGANGSGKSTLLRLLAGVTVPTSGRISRSDRWRSVRVAYVPQAGGLYDDLSVDANFELREILYGSAPARDSLIERLRLGEWLPIRAADLSGGYRRLIATVVALSVAPDVLIMDEPFEGLDAENRAPLTEILAELASTTALMVTATPDEAYPMPAVNGILQFDQGGPRWLRRLPSA